MATDKIKCRIMERQIRINERLKSICRSRGICRHLNGSYTPESFIDTFDMLLTDDDKNFIASIDTKIETGTDCFYNKIPKVYHN